MKKSRITLFREHFKIKHDEEIFYSYQDQFNKEPAFDIKEIRRGIDDSKSALSCLADLSKAIDRLEMPADTYASLSYDVEEVRRNMTDVPDYVELGIKGIDDVYEWGHEWKNIAMEFLSYLLNNHPEMLDEIGIINHSVDENTFKSLEAINKYDL